MPLIVSCLSFKNKLSFNLQLDFLAFRCPISVA